MSKLLAFGIGGSLYGSALGWLLVLVLYLRLDRFYGIICKKS